MSIKRLILLAVLAAAIACGVVLWVRGERGGATVGDAVAEIEGRKTFRGHLKPPAPPQRLRHRQRLQGIADE
jgi:hypothetical protein